MKDQGFTLIELLIVIALIGILAILTLAFLTPSIKKARDAKRKEHYSEIEKTLYVYETDRGEYPNSLADLITTGVWQGTLPVDPLEKNEYDNDLGSTIKSDYEVADVGAEVRSAFRLWTEVENPNDPNSIGSVYYRCGGNFTAVAAWSGTCL